MTATCWGCDAASKNMRSACYTHGCRECDLRALAQSPVFHQSVGYTNPRDWSPTYKHALVALFGSAWGEGHKRCVAWSDKMHAEIERLNDAPRKRDSQPSAPSEPGA